ncbi:hypothetical protein [Nitrincola sp. A-D6]|uniref:hypothetical protein n=1 Tax=Nitrincola sp. A-D6 TaxID=1545442 RepID=UPI00055AF855|nr:hypothetical protein [Nitrincola sp. A-D6]
MQTDQQVQCKQYYESTYLSLLEHLDDKPKALDACLQRFLNQRPTGKHRTNADRAVGLIESEFWSDTESVNQSKYAALALSKVLGHHEKVSASAVLQIAKSTPDTFRWAIA